MSDIDELDAFFRPTELSPIGRCWERMRSQLAARDAELAQARATVEGLREAMSSIAKCDRCASCNEIALAASREPKPAGADAADELTREAQARGEYDVPASSRRADAPQEPGASSTNGDGECSCFDSESDFEHLHAPACPRSPFNATPGASSDAEEALAAVFEPGCDAGCAHGHWTVDPVAWLTSRDRATAERVRRETWEEAVRELRMSRGSREDAAWWADWLAARGPKGE